MEDRVLFGDIIWSSDRSTFSQFCSSYLVIENGKVAGVFKDLPERFRHFRIDDWSGKIIIPGMSDLHVHAPQYQYRGLWMDMELLDWLDQHTFPEESRYSDISYADEAYSIFTDDLLHSPTTRVCAFATMHLESSLLLMKKLEDAGMRGYVGKVSMDRNSPDILRESTEDAVRSVLEFLDRASDFSNVKPVVTPRFIPTCSDELMRELGRISKERHIPVQSHLSENPGEIAWVQELVPKSKSYADAYHLFGLMGEEKTVMAHCVYSYERELELLQNPNVFAAHCPDSNSNLYSGIARITALIDAGVNVGLGSDVAGGEEISLFQAAVNAVKVSKLAHRITHPEDRMLSFAEAFWLATRGGGEFFSSVGAFEEGYDGDAVVLDDSSIHTTLKDSLTLAERLEQYASLRGRDRVKAKYVMGKRLAL
ncbi:MAG: amidohydrolase family protein [Bullifex sp.]